MMGPVLLEKSAWKEIAEHYIIIIEHHEYVNDMVMRYS